MQGFNMGRYVPPEFEGVMSGNALQNKNALGARARKSKQGITIVRFEMPFAIWCLNCPREEIIGQGVRFNAEKKKVGNYYTTPIWSFRMKHTACQGWIEIRTDPKNTAYVVTEGARKRDTGEDKVLEGDIVIMTPEERQRLAEDAFAALEHKITDRKAAEMAKTRIEDLISDKEKFWDDPAEQNRRLRRTFRVERKEREKRAVQAEDVKSKFGLGIDLLEESEGDREHAETVTFGDPESTFRKSKADPRRSLRRQLAKNTMNSLDPFSTASSSTGVEKLGVKRKLDASGSPNTGDEPPAPSALVQYDSD